MLFISSRSDGEEEDEIDDNIINKILIMTQTPPSIRKHPGGDRTGDYVPRSKMTAELAKVINDSLFYYEKEMEEEEDFKVRSRVMVESRVMTAQSGQLGGQGLR